MSTPRNSHIPLLRGKLCAALLLCVLGAPLISGADEAPAAKAVLTVSLEKPQLSALAQKIQADGAVQAWQEAVIASESNGLRLEELKVNVGDVVQKGQLLAQFSSLTLAAELQQAKAALAEAQANANEAQANAARARTLRESGMMSAQQVTQLLTLEQTMRAKVEVQQAALKAQQVKLAQAQVRAPDDGVISARSASVGAVAASGQELFRMIRRNRLEWRAELNAGDLLKVSPGMTARIFSAENKALSGKVRMAAPALDSKTRTGIAYIDLSPDSWRQLKAGMFAKGEIELGASDALTVSQQALVVRDGFHYVFVLGPQQKVRQVKVEAGRRSGERVEVRGIAAETQLVASGAGFLHDGDLVKVAGAAPAMAAKSSVAAK